MDDNSSSEGYGATKGTDYPAKPDPSSLEGYSAIKGTDYPAKPQGRVQEYPASESTPGIPPSKPRFPWKKVVWFSVGAIVILGAGAAYVYYKSLPFRISGDKIIVRDSQGGAIEISTRPELPDSFPPDIPIFPESKLVLSSELIESDDPEQEGSVYQWEATAPLEDVGFWYIAELESQGWDIPLRSPGLTSIVLTATKDGRGFIIELQGVSSTETNISLVFAVEFPQ